VRTLDHQPHEGRTGREEITVLIAGSLRDTHPEVTPGWLRAACPGNELAADIADALDVLLGTDDEDQADEEEPYCAACSASIGVFIGHGSAYLHFTGQGTVASLVERNRTAGSHA
jgi:hypothetical protein